MVKYKLVVRDKNEYKEVIWNKDEYEKFDRYKLKDIDEFTGKFKTHVDLTSELIRITALNPEFINRKLQIRYDFRGSNKVVRYGIALEDDAKFLDPYYITSYLNEHYDDEILIEKICNRYSNTHALGYPINLLKKHLRALKLGHLTKFDMYDYKQAVLELVDRIVYVHDSVDFAYVMDNKGTAKINYRQLHDLGIFLAYDYKTRKWKSVKEAQDVKVKTKTKKDNDIPGQYSIFDY